jgi:hypothetical protein
MVAAKLAAPVSRNSATHLAIFDICQFWKIHGE